MQRLHKLNVAEKEENFKNTWLERFSVLFGICEVKVRSFDGPTRKIEVVEVLFSCFSFFFSCPYANLQDSKNFILKFYFKNSQKK